MLLHEEGNHDGGRSTDASIAMYEHSAFHSKGIVQESVASRKMLFQIGTWTIQLLDPLVGVLLRVFRDEPAANGQDVGDAVSIQNVLALRCYVIAKE